MSLADIAWDAFKFERTRWRAFAVTPEPVRGKRGRRARRAAFYHRTRRARLLERVMNAALASPAGRQAAKAHQEAMRAWILGLPVVLSYSDGRVEVLTMPAESPRNHPGS